MDASEWFGVKQDMPLAFPNLPYFIDGDVKISENLAIMEYICMKWKPELLGNTPEERGIVCMLAGVFDPLRSEVTRASYMNKEREPILEQIKTRLPPFYAYLGNKAFLAGTSVTWVDIAFYEFVLVLHFIQPNLYTEYPLLEPYVQRVADLSGLKEYLADKTNI